MFKWPRTFSNRSVFFIIGILGFCFSIGACTHQPHSSSLTPRHCGTVHNRIYNFSEDRAAVEGKDGKFFYITRSGQELNADRYDLAWDFSNGLGLVRKQAKYFFIKHDGNLLDRDGFEMAWSFYEGVSRVTKNGQEFLINTKGERVSD